MKFKGREFIFVIIIFIEIIFINVFLASMFYSGSNKDKQIKKPNKKVDIVEYKKESISESTDSLEKVLLKELIKEPSKDESITIEKIFNNLFNNKIEPTDLKISWGINSRKKFFATAYDLSLQSCSKSPGSKDYGVTYSGKYAEIGRTVAVDPEIIPIGSQLYIEFPSGYMNFNGWYTAEDTGNGIKGYAIDVFFGEEATKEAMSFGKRIVNVLVLYTNTL